MDFKDIVGQEKVVRYLKKSIADQKIAHAYAFDGPQGIGKTWAAMAFAKGILCKKGGGSPCNVCTSCIKVNNGNHPDIQIIAPEGNSIKNKQIENFQHDLLRKPYESHKKIYIIQQANEMTVSAQNRLLKTLEEPPEYAVIILISSNINGFLPTIKSRCQILKFHNVGQKCIEEYLMKKYEISTTEAKVLAAFSHGIVGNAVRLKESDDFRQKREAVVAVIEQLFTRDASKVFELVEFFQNHKDEIYGILDMMLFWFRDLLLLKETGSDQFLINLDKKATLQKHLNYIRYEKISNIINIIEKTKTDIKANVNFQLAMEIMLLNIQEV